MKAKTIFSALFMMGAMMTAPLFAQNSCEAEQEASCGSCAPCAQVVVVRPKCDLFSGLRCRPVCDPCTPCQPVCKPVCKPVCVPCKPVCKPVCVPCKPVCKPVCVPCKPVCKPVCVPCKPVCKPVCVPCKPVCKPVCVPCCKKFVVKPICTPCAPACAPEACAPAEAPEACAPACAPEACAPEATCGDCGTCDSCTTCCAPCRPLLTLFRQVNCDLQVAACQINYDLQMTRFRMAAFRCNVQANVEQCKAEAEAREACRIAARSGACGEVEVCVPNRCRPGAAIKGIFRTLFGTPCCEAAPACGCETAPACGCEVAPEGEEVSEVQTLTPAPAAVTEENVEVKVEEKTEDIDASILPEADPTSVSGEFYSPSNSIVLR